MSKAADLFAEPLDWLFWPPLRPRPDSAWLGHIPFAHWLVGALRPRQLVELGTFSGASYAAFCDATLRHGTGGRCVAVDTWVGDKHVGNYGEQIHADLERFNADRFAGFSRLLKKTFDDALDDIADGSVDLLHIDGLHTYEAVRHDFDSWQQKLSDRAVVLFHDAAERRDDFGVWKLWEELVAERPGFLFEHSHGLGVLQVGSEMAAPLRVLFELDSEAERQLVRDRFEALGHSVRNTAYAARMHIEAQRLGEMLRRATAPSSRRA